MSCDGSEPIGRTERGGHPFAINAVLSTDSLTLTTNGVSYVLVLVTEADGLRVGPDDPRPAGPCEWPADQALHGIPTHVEAFVATEVDTEFAGDGRVAIEFFVEEPWDDSLEETVGELLLDLREELPDLRVLRRVGILGLGASATSIDIRGTDWTGEDVTFRIVIALHGERVYGLLLEAVSEDFAAYEPLFDRVQASFALLGTPGPPPVESVAYGGTFEGDGSTLSLEPSSAGGLAPGVRAFETTLRFGDEEPPKPPCNPLVPGSCLEPEPPCNPLAPGSCSGPQPDPGPDPPGPDPVPGPRQIAPDVQEGLGADNRGDIATARALWVQAPPP